MYIRWPMLKSIWLIAAFCWVCLLFTAGPYSGRLLVQSDEARAVPADKVQIDGQYLEIDGRRLDLKQRPAIFIDSSSRDLLVDLMLIPSEKRPHIVVTADSQPEFMPPDWEYYWSPHITIMSPALVWYEDTLIGCMYSAVKPQLGRMRYPLLIGEGQVRNRLTEGAGQNALTAALQLDGVVVHPGETFSFYEHVVPSAENGYVEGLTLFNTETGPQWKPDIGGGICATATALNFAVEKALLQVTERHSHTEAVSYAPLGQDTAVARSAGWDYRFRNTGPIAVKISAEQYGDYLRFRIYAVLDD